MNDILAIVDALESRILEGKKVPFTDKVMLAEQPLLMLIDKIRITLKNEPDTIRRAVEMDTETPPVTPKPSSDPLKKAQTDASRIREDATVYADNVLAHLQLIVTKMQKNIIKLEQNLESGRTMLIQLDKKEDPHA